MARGKLVVGFATLALGMAAVQAAAIPVVSRGEAVRLEDHLVAGRWVLFDFSAQWCSACRQLEPRLERLARRGEATVAVRKVDVVSWESEVARQFRIRSLPHLKLYDPDGRLVAEGGAPAVLARLEPVLRDAGVALEEEGGDGGYGPLAGLIVAAAVAAALILTRRRGGVGGSSEEAPAGDVDAGGGEAIWFAMVEGGLEGPFTVGELEEMVRRRRIPSDAGARRRGDRELRSVDDVIESFD